MSDYQDLVDAVERSQESIETFVAGISDAQLAEPSSLSGWTRGHLLAHISRNAGGVYRLVHGVISDEPSEMYPGGQEARNSLIEEGAYRPIALAAADLAYSGRRLIAELRALPTDKLTTTMPWRTGVPAAAAPLLRLTELEVHRVDLDLGYSPTQWPAELVTPLLALELPRLGERAPGVSAPDLPDNELLAWLIGRPTRQGLPDLPPWR